MRKFTRLITSILALAMLFTLATAAMATETPTPYALTKKCVLCQDGKVYHTESRKFDDEIHRPHNGHTDIIYSYDVIIDEYCDKCDYTYHHEYEEEVIISCKDRG